MHEGDPADFAWDVVTGISAGAINTAALALWDKDDGLAMSEWVSTLWAGLTNGDIWAEWPEGIVASLLTESSLLDDRPLLAYLEGILNEFPEGCKRYAMVGTVDFNTADYQRWYLDEIPLDKLTTVAP